MTSESRVWHLGDQRWGTGEPSTVPGSRMCTESRSASDCVSVGATPQRSSAHQPVKVHIIVIIIIRVSFSSFWKWVVLHPSSENRESSTPYANKNVATPKQFSTMKHSTVDSRQMQSLQLSCTLNIVSIQYKSIVNHSVSQPASIQ